MRINGADYDNRINYFSINIRKIEICPAVFSSGGSNSTPPQTSTKAKSVAMLVKSRTKVLSVNRIGTPTTNPVMIVAKEGVLNFECIF